MDNLDIKNIHTFFLRSSSFQLHAIIWVFSELKEDIMPLIIVFSGQWRLPWDGHRKLTLAHWSNHGRNSRSYRAWKNLIPTHSSCAQWRDTEEVHTGKSVSNNAGVLQHFRNKVHLCIIVSTMYRTYNFLGVFF